MYLTFFLFNVTLALDSSTIPAQGGLAFIGRENKLRLLPPRPATTT
ncbi:MAG: hypothetical protein WCG31_10550 [Deltaproteobacteria bacterium]